MQQIAINVRLASSLALGNQALNFIKSAVGTRNAALYNVASDKEILSNNVVGNKV